MLIGWILMSVISAIKLFTLKSLTAEALRRPFSILAPHGQPSLPLVCLDSLPIKKFVKNKINNLFHNNHNFIYYNFSKNYYNTSHHSIKKYWICSINCYSLCQWHRKGCWNEFISEAQKLKICILMGTATIVTISILQHFTLK